MNDEYRMRAITLWQPWASAFAIGYKTIETRSWNPKRLHCGQLIAIHSAKRQHNQLDLMDIEDHLKARGFDDVEDVVKPFKDMPHGCVVAVGRFVASCRTEHLKNINCVPSSLDLSFGNFAPGRFAWVFDRIMPVEEPVETKGSQGLWFLPADVSQDLLHMHHEWQSKNFRAKVQTTG